MKIVFVVDKCFNLYHTRTFYNLISLMGDRHDLQYIKLQKNLMAKLQEMKPDILYLIIGGKEHGEIVEIFRGKAVTVAASCEPFEGCDITINSELEQVFPELIEALEHGKDLSTVKGITYQQKTNKAAEKWDITSIKPTSRNDSFLTFSTRGCKGQCSFCCIRQLQGTLRFRPVPEVIAEIKSFSSIKGYKDYFQFADPSFDSNTPERMKEIAKAIITDLPSHTYEANFRPDFHKIADDELMNLLVESGLTKAFIGVESGNEADLQLYNKRTTISDAEETIRLFQKYDITIYIGFIMFNPFSTFERLRENLSLLEKNRLATYNNLTGRFVPSRELPIIQTINEEGLLCGELLSVRDIMTYALMMILDDIENSLNKKALEIYSLLSTEFATFYKRTAAQCEDSEVYAIAEKYEKLMQSVIMFESVLMAEWFRNILDLMDKSKPLTEIMAMSNRYLNNDKLKVTIKYFKALEKSMFLELKELNISREEPENIA